MPEPMEPQLTHQQRRELGQERKLLDALDRLGPLSWDILAVGRATVTARRLDAKGLARLVLDPSTNKLTLRPNESVDDERSGTNQGDAGEASG